MSEPRPGLPRTAGRILHPPPRRRKLHIACGDFLMLRIKSRLALAPLLLLSAKSHARLACSVVNALATARCRYQLFAGNAGLNPSIKNAISSFLHPPPVKDYKKDIVPENPDFIGVFGVQGGCFSTCKTIDINRLFCPFE